MGDFCLPAGCSGAAGFQSTPTYGGRPGWTHRDLREEKFQSTPTYGGRQEVLEALIALLEFQSTPTYGGRPDLNPEKSKMRRVSIHAHVRWATESRSASRSYQVVSIHAHVRWATKSRAPKPALVLPFQSTPTYGGRPVDPSTMSHRFACFNPRPRTVGDGEVPITLVDGAEFQSTPTYGGRRYRSKHP